MSLRVLIICFIILLTSCYNIANNSGQKTFLFEDVMISVPDSTAKYYEKNNHNKFIKWKNFSIQVQTGYMAPDIFLDLPEDSSITLHHFVDSSSYKSTLYTTPDFVIIYTYMDMKDSWLSDESFRIVSFKSIANDKNEMIKLLDVFKTIKIKNKD